MSQFIPLSPISSFNTTSGSSGVYALASTDRVWKAPQHHVIRIDSTAADDAYIRFGSSTITVSSTAGTRVLGGLVDYFAISPADTYIAVKSSTDIILNVCLGYGR